MSFSVRAYRPGDEQQILGLFQHVFRQPRAMAHWRWKFGANPAGHQISLAVTDHGRIIGQFAGLPVRAVTRDAPFQLSQGIDHMVDPEFQNQGVFAAMTRHFVASFLPPAGDVVFYSYPLAHKHSIDQRISDAELVHPVRALARNLGLVEPWRRRAGSGWETWRHRVVRVERFGPAVDRLWASQRRELAVTTVRDAAYLNWRYADCPDVAYTLLQVESRLTGRVRGIAVLRFGWFEEPIAPVLELLGPAGDLPALQLLLGACHDLARERGLGSMRVWMPKGTPLHPALLAAGYADEATPFLLTKLADPDVARTDAMRTRWTYSMGDSDIY